MRHVTGTLSSRWKVFCVCKEYRKLVSMSLSWNYNLLRWILSSNAKKAEHQSQPNSIPNHECRLIYTYAHPYMLLMQSMRIAENQLLSIFYILKFSHFWKFNHTYISSQFLICDGNWQISIYFHYSDVWHQRYFSILGRTI